MCEAVHAVGSEQRTHTQVKKKWSDVKVEVKRRVSAHRRSGQNIFYASLS